MRGRKAQTQIFSIFGQIEEVAANLMIERHKLHRIKAEDIPPTAAVNDTGQTAKFAVVMPANLIVEFNELIRSLRA